MAQDGRHHLGEPARLEDLGPAGSQREVVLRRCVEVALEVGPPVDRIPMAEGTVELDQCPLGGVADVPVHGPADRLLAELPVPLGKPVCSFDVAQIPLLEDGPGPRVHIGQDLAQQSTTWEPRQLRDYLQQPGAVVSPWCTASDSRAIASPSVRSPAAFSRA